MIEQLLHDLDQCQIGEHNQRQHAEKLKRQGHKPENPRDRAKRVGLCAIIIWLARLNLPDYAAIITFSNLGLAFIMVVVIAAISSYVGVRKVLRIEPFDIFRG